MSRAAVLGLVLLAAGRLASRASAEEPCSGNGPLENIGVISREEWRFEILIQHNPTCAALLLNGQTGNSGLRINEAQEPELFRAALELKDLRTLLADPQATAAIRDGLSARATCEFCQSPPQLEAWARKHMAATYPSAKDARNTLFLRYALYDWDVLPQDTRRWLGKNPKIASDWPGYTFAQRRSVMAAWGKSIHDFIMTAKPENYASASSLFALHGADLNDAQLREANDHLHKLKQAADGLAEARRLVTSSSGARVKDLLAKSQTGTLDERLAAMSTLFDSLGRHRAALSAVAPDKPGQGFDRDTRAVFGKVLGKELLDMTRGTWAGEGDPRGSQEGLRAFYARVPLIISVQKASPSAIAYYLDGQGRFVFNETFIENFARSEGVTARQLLTDPTKRRELAYLLVPFFVHEARHHQQDLWAKAHNIPMLSGAPVEQDAMQTEAIFIMQKAADPAFRNAINKHPDSSLASNVAGLADAMRRLGPAGFRSLIMTGYYADSPSLESQAWLGLDSFKKDITRLQLELERRRGLPPVEQKALMNAPPFQASYPNDAALNAAFRKVGTRSIQAWLTSLQASDQGVPRIYQDWNARSNGLNAAVSAEYQELNKYGLRPIPPTKIAIPSPAART